MIVVDAVPLGVATEQAGTDEDTDGDDDAERLDWQAHVELAEPEERQRGESGDGYAQGVHAGVSLQQAWPRAIIPV